MRSVLLVVFLVAGCSGAPHTTAQHQLIRDTEEANKLGLTLEQYSEKCSVDTNDFMLTDGEKADMNTEAAAVRKAGPPRFSDKSEVMSALKKHMYKTHAILQKRLAIMEKALKDMDEKSKQFFHTVGDSFLEVIVTVSRATQHELENPFELFHKFGKQIKKAFTDYDALPQSSKDAIEKRFCIRSSFRIMDTTGKLSQLLAIAKAGLKY
ncbi:hypothetical protein PRIPAC_78087 [Pristionchus pacificus]|uniref:Fatty-acid and retinol-binding protein 1 n=1 Tax=Pristionchus pacificus TaxID=54126 RepID=A0A8R1Z6W6_PRIPA|nr:hypothetical protein PRIPAC_78087 [Pristionchus pacificus]